MLVSSLFKCSKVCHGKLPYMSPSVLMEADILLETGLLATSVYMKSEVETAGQGNDGYYNESAIEGGNTVDNYWSD